MIFIKLFDERIANALCEGGFSYTTEKFNDNQTAYCFEKTDDLMVAIRSFQNIGSYQEMVIVEDSVLHF